MSKELNEAADKIKSLRDLFLKECKKGSWKSLGYDRYINKYFEISYVNDSSVGSKKWTIIFDREKIYCQEINISKIYFFFLRIIVKRNSKNYERDNRSIQIGRMSDRFFNEHKELKRDKKLDKLLN
jgi:hypothetical protein